MEQTMQIQGTKESSSSVSEVTTSGIVSVKELREINFQLWKYFIKQLERPLSDITFLSSLIQPTWIKICQTGLLHWGQKLELQDHLRMHQQQNWCLQLVAAGGKQIELRQMGQGVQCCRMVWKASSSESIDFYYLTFELPMLIQQSNQLTFQDFPFEIAHSSILQLPWYLRRELYNSLAALLSQGLPFEIMGKEVTLEKLQGVVLRLGEEKECVLGEALSLSHQFFKRYLLSNSLHNIYFLDQAIERVVGLKPNLQLLISEIIGELSGKLPLQVFNLLVKRKADKDLKTALYCLSGLGDILSVLIEEGNGQVVIQCVKRMGQALGRCHKKVISRVNQLMLQVFSQVSDPADAFLTLLPEDSRAELTRLLSAAPKSQRASLKLLVTQVRRKTVDLVTALPSKILEYDRLDSKSKMSMAQLMLERAENIKQQLDRSRDYNSLFQVFVLMNQQSNYVIVTSLIKTLTLLLPLLATATPRHPMRLILAQSLARTKPPPSHSLFQLALEQKVVSADQTLDLFCSQFEKLSLQSKENVFELIQRLSQQLGQGCGESGLRKLTKMRSSCPAKIRKSLALMQPLQNLFSAKKNQRREENRQPNATLRQPKDLSVIKLQTQELRPQSALKCSPKRTLKASLQKVRCQSPKPPKKQTKKQQLSLVQLSQMLESAQVETLLKQYLDFSGPNFVEELQQFILQVHKKVRSSKDESLGQTLSQFILELTEKLARKHFHLIDKIALAAVFRIGKAAQALLQIHPSKLRLSQLILQRLVRENRLTNTVKGFFSLLANLVPHAKLLKQFREFDCHNCRLLRSHLGLSQRESRSRERRESMSQQKQMLEKRNRSKPKKQSTAEKGKMAKQLKEETITINQQPPQIIQERIQESEFVCAESKESKSSGVQGLRPLALSSLHSIDNPAQSQDSSRQFIDFGKQFITERLNYSFERNHSLEHTLELASEVKPLHYATLNSSQQEDLEEHIIPILKRQFSFGDSQVDLLFQLFLSQNYNPDKALLALYDTPKALYLKQIPSFYLHSNKHKSTIQRLFHAMADVHYSAQESALFYPVLKEFCREQQGEHALKLLDNLHLFIGQKRLEELAKEEGAVISKGKVEQTAEPFSLHQELKPQPGKAPSIEIVQDDTPLPFQSLLNSHSALNLTNLRNILHYKPNLRLHLYQSILQPFSKLLPPHRPNFLRQLLTFYQQERPSILQHESLLWLSIQLCGNEACLRSLQKQEKDSEILGLVEDIYETCLQQISPENCCSNLVTYLEGHIVSQPAKGPSLTRLHFQSQTSHQHSSAHRPPVRH